MEMYACMCMYIYLSYYEHGYRTLKYIVCDLRKRKYAREKRGRWEGENKSIIVSLRLFQVSYLRVDRTL